jgi:hypothetical protein
MAVVSCSISNFANRSRRIGPGLCRILYMDFREHLPIFLFVVWVNNLDGAQGAEHGSRTPRHRRWL